MHIFMSPAPLDFDFLVRLMLSHMFVEPQISPSIIVYRANSMLYLETSALLEPMKFWVELA